MAFLPVNILFVAIYLFGVAWGWEGEELRRLFAVVSSIFMFSLWLIPLYTITFSTTISFVSSPRWLPTNLLENILFWNAILMYWTGVHLIEMLGLEDPVSKVIKKVKNRKKKA